MTDYPHQRVWHAAQRYVIEAVHTNTIEGFWSIFKRGVVGSFHKVSIKRDLGIAVRRYGTFAFEPREGGTSFQSDGMMLRKSSRAAAATVCADAAITIATQQRMRLSIAS